MEHDEFDSIVDGLDISDGATAVLSPDRADDHMALHVLEAALQVMACLDITQYAIDRVTEPSFPLVAEFGLNEWINASFLDGEIDDDAENFPAWMLAVRSMASDLTIACEEYLRAHRIPRMYFMVHLSGHGWNTMVITTHWDEEDED